MEAMQSWDQWKNFLAQNIKVANLAGTSQDAVVDAATRIGDFLARNVDPANPQQRVLSELWKVANEQEKHAIASCIIKMLSDGVRH